MINPRRGGREGHGAGAYAALGTQGPLRGWATLTVTLGSVD